MKRRYILFAVLAGLVILYAIGETPDSVDYEAYRSEELVVDDALKLYYSSQEQQGFKKNNKLLMTYRGARTPYSILYLHGFSATPEEGMPTLQHVTERIGWNMYAPILHGHGRITDEPLLDYRADSAYASAVRALSIAKTLGDSVIIMATSTGCALAHRMAASEPFIAGLIYYSPNVRPVDPTSSLLNDPWGETIAKTVLGSNYRDVGITEPYYEQHWYRYYRIESLPEMMELIEGCFESSVSEQIHQPLLLAAWYENEEIQDDAVSVEKMREMFEDIPHDNKEFLELAAGTHVIANGHFSKVVPQLERATLDFLQQFKQRTIADTTSSN